MKMLLKIVSSTNVPSDVSVWIVIGGAAALVVVLLIAWAILKS
jgi:hypothetical protein